ncbi:LemA family protein, partial [Arthrospira platensis SPKY1]|nr:LemA family protein [Arthrospira platensis SPKY1]
GTQALARADALLAAARARVLALLDLQAEWREAQAVAPLAQVLRATEPELNFARQWFNAAVQAYNDAARQWPTRLLTRLFGFGMAGRL